MGTEKKEDDDKKQTPAFELGKDPAFLELAKTIKGMTTIIQQQGIALNSLKQQIETAGTSKGKEKDEDDRSDDDVDSMSQKELAGFLIKQVGKLVDDKFKGINDNLESTRKEFRTTTLNQTVKEFAKDHKDFNEWGEEMTELAKENPTLTIPRLYALARTENPDKTKKLDDKYTDKTEKKPLDDGELKLFGGYKPSGKTTQEGEGADKTKKTLDEALESAWSDALEQFPALSKMGEDAA